MYMIEEKLRFLIYSNSSCMMPINSETKQENDKKFNNGLPYRRVSTIYKITLKKGEENIEEGTSLP